MALSDLQAYQPLMNSLQKLEPAQKQQSLQRLCLTDLYFLLAFVLRRKDAQRPFVFARCQEVEKAPNGYLDLWAREHYKSTIITFAKTIQDILADPEITIALFSHTRGIAKGFLRQIMREFEDNELLKEIFPDVLWANPKTEAPKWSEDDGIIVKRKSNPKESTLEAWGLVDGQPTSRHFKGRVYDDTVTKESVNTSEQIKKTTEAWELSNNLGMENGWERYIGTRYSLHDTYNEMIKRKAVDVRLYAATHNGRMDGKPVFFSQKTWEDKLRKQSRRTIAAQLLQNPLADEDATFLIQWLRPYEIRPRTMNVYILCDPSKGRNATSDNTAIAVIGVAASNSRYLLDGYCHRMTLSQRWVALRDLYQKWAKTPGVQIIEVGYERYGAQTDDEYFQLKMEEEKFYFTIKELNWVFEGSRGEQGKTSRVERMEPDVRNSRFYLPSNVWHDGQACTWHIDNDPDSKTFHSVIHQKFEGFSKQQLRVVDAGSPDLISKAIKRVNEEKQTYDLSERFIEEYLTFPFGTHDDLLDACSRLYDMEPRAPMVIEKGSTEPNVYQDS